VNVALMSRLFGERHNADDDDDDDGDDDDDDDTYMIFFVFVCFVFIFFFLACVAKTPAGGQVVRRTRPLPLTTVCLLRTRQPAANSKLTNHVRSVRSGLLCRASSAIELVAPATLQRLSAGCPGNLIVTARLLKVTAPGGCLLKKINCSIKPAVTP